MRKKKQIDTIVQSLKDHNIEFTQRNISLTSGTVTLLYIKELTQRAELSEQVIKPLMINTDAYIKAADAMNNIIFSDICKLDSDLSKVEAHILSGMTVALFSNDQQYIVIDLKKVEKRSVAKPESNYSFRGPRDCFIESIESNISLIRYRIKDKNLRIDTMEVGERTKTGVAVLYIEDIANNTCVTEVKKRLDNISIDGIIESGELESMLLNKKVSLFPQMGLVERSDMACSELLEGKVVILVDGSCWGLIAPKTLSEFLWSSDDKYTNKFFSLMTRMLRVFALFTVLIISPLYVAIVSFHNDMLPSSYMIAIAEARAKVPFNALTEVLLITIIADLITESLVRVPSKIGTAIGIVGAIIIGQAAVSAGVFSPLLLIVISISLISQFVPSDMSISFPILILRYGLIIATGFFGLYGFTIFIIMILANVVSINTFGIPYIAPYAPFNKKDFFKTIMDNKSLSPYRARFLRTKDKIRGPGNMNQK